MSNRTLLEINHDLWHRIKEDPAQFASVLTRYLGSASADTAEPLERFGIRVFGMRHHSEGFKIEWGCHNATEHPSRR